jgi:NDMA-dependent alcohol dehydrogenase
MEIGEWLAVQTKGAVLRGVHEPWLIEEIEMGAPRSHEVTVQLAACGLCHSDAHIVSGDQPVGHWPVLGGHEAAGTIVDIGPDAEKYKVGDRVVLSAIPSCGQCPPCLRGYGSLCDEGYRAASGEAITDNTYRAKAGDDELASFCCIGGFAPYTTVHEWSLVKVEKDIPLELAALLGCGVPTGWGAAVHVAQVRPGDTAVVIGLGGVGASALLGVVHAGAERAIVVDTAESKREWAFELGATHFFTSIEEATLAIREETWARMADEVIIVPARMEGWMIQAALDMTGKMGTVAAVAAGAVTPLDMQVNIAQLRGYQKSIKGVLQGGRSPKADITTLIHLYVAGKLPLEKLVTARYKLEDINQGYQDMVDGKNLRGLLVY